MAEPLLPINGSAATLDLTQEQLPPAGPSSESDDRRPATPERLADLLYQPEQREHYACGVRRRPCWDCRRTAPLPCVGPATRGIHYLCRPCAATWRCRMWRMHPLRIRRWHCLADQLPRLLDLPPETGAELVKLLGRIVRRVVQRRLADE
jgi:hypothetical protein